MKKIFTIFILLSLFGLSSAIGQQKMFYLKGATAPYSIYSANLDGTGETLIVAGVVANKSASYRNGKICYNTGSQIKVINVDGTGNIAVPNTNDAVINSELCFSPDGNKIVYSGSTNNYKLFIINIDGTGKFTLNNGTSSSQHQNYPSWNETGKIYFGMSNLGDPYSQRIYSKLSNDSTATPTQLTTAFAQFPISGGPNNKVAFNIQTGPLYIMNSDGSAQTLLSGASTDVNSSGVWSLVDSTIFYINGGNVWKIKMNNTGNTQITTTGNIVSVFGIDNVSNSVNLQNGLVAYYPFNGNANDESGNGNTGTLNGSVLLTADRFNHANSAFLFNGTGAWINTNVMSITNNNSMSLVAWIKTNQTISAGIVCSRSAPAMMNGISTNGNNVGLDISDGNTNYAFQSYSSGFNYCNNDWHLVVGTYDGTISRIYVDGVLKNSVTYSFNIVVGANFKIGYDDINPIYTGGIHRYFNGVIDDVRIYNRALNSQEIQALFQGVQQSIQATITIPDTIRKITQVIDIPVKTTTLNTSSNIISYQFNLTYDTTKLQYSNKSLIGTIALGGNVIVNNSILGKLSISYMTSTPLSGAGSIVNLQFIPKQIGNSQLVISNFLFNTDTITYFQNGNITAIGKYGDIDTNSFIQAYDAALALQYSVGLDPFPIIDPRPWENWRKIVANVDATDSISANDASLILQYSAGLITTFPVGNAKSLSDPIADILITQVNNELVFTSTGDLYGLNIYANNGTTVTMNAPIVLDPNMLIATNITGTTYNIGLCTAYSPNDNTEIMRIPFTCTTSENLAFNMIINKNSVTKNFNVNCLVGITQYNKQSFNVYPNPANDKIEIDGLKKGSIEIFNLQGQSIKTINILNVKSIIDISDLTNGIYTIKINTEKRIFIQKLIKQ